MPCSQPCDFCCQNRRSVAKAASSACPSLRTNCRNHPDLHLSCLVTVPRLFLERVRGYFLCDCRFFSLFPCLFFFFFVSVFVFFYYYYLYVIFFFLIPFQCSVDAGSASQGAAATSSLGITKTGQVYAHPLPPLQANSVCKNPPQSEGAKAKA